MDKYQSKLLERNKQLTLDSAEGKGNVELIDSTLVLTQNENYNIKQYTLNIVNDAIASVQVDGKAIRGNGSFEIPIDFDKRVKKIVILFSNNFADPCEFDVKYKESDKEAYDEKVIAHNKAMRLANMCATCKTGDALVNFYWGKASDDYAYSLLSLYVYTGRNDENQYLLMQEFKIENGVFYKSISDLAFEEYVAELSQFDQNDRLIISTELKFSIDDFKDKVIETLKKELEGVKGQIRLNRR